MMLHKLHMQCCPPFLLPWRGLRYLTFHKLLFAKLKTFIANIINKKGEIFNKDSIKSARWIAATGVWELVTREGGET